MSNGGVAHGQVQPNSQQRPTGVRMDGACGGKLPKHTWCCSPTKNSASSSIGASDLKWNVNMGLSNLTIKGHSTRRQTRPGEGETVSCVRVCG